MKCRSLLTAWFCLALCSSVMAQSRQEAPLALEQGEAKAENTPEFYLQLIAGMQQKQLHFAAMAHLDAFELRWPDDRRAMLLRAEALRETGYLERAKRLYRHLLEREPLAAAHHGLGLIAAREGDLPLAHDALTQAVRLMPINVRMLNDLGYVQLLLGKSEEARLSLAKAAELEQQNPLVGANLALLHLLEGRAERAGQIMEKYAFPAAQREEIERTAARLRESRRSPGVAAIAREVVK